MHLEKNLTWMVCYKVHLAISRVFSTKTSEKIKNVFIS